MNSVKNGRRNKPNPRFSLLFLPCDACVASPYGPFIFKHRARMKFQIRSNSGLPQSGFDRSIYVYPFGASASARSRARACSAPGRLKRVIRVARSDTIVMLRAGPD